MKFSMLSPLEVIIVYSILSCFSSSFFYIAQVAYSSGLPEHLHKFRLQDLCLNTVFICMSLCHSIPFIFFPPEGQSFIFFTFTSLGNYYLFNNEYITMMLRFFPHLGYVSWINLSYCISYFSYMYIYTMCSWLENIFSFIFVYGTRPCWSSHREA